MFAPIGSHLPILVALARRRRIQSVLEFGSGMHSTSALLRKHLFPDVRGVLSLETNESFFDVVEEALGGDDRLHLALWEPTKDWQTFAGAAVSRVCDLVLVDCDPYPLRINVLDSLRETDVVCPVILHDVESYYYDEARLRWPHCTRYTPVPGMPDTAILSLRERIDLDQREIEDALALLRGEVFE